MSIAARALSLAFLRTSPKTIAIFRANAIREFQETPPSIWSGEDDNLTATWGDVVRAPLPPPPLTVQFRRSLPVAERASRQPPAAPPQPSGLKGTERQRVAELRRQFAMLLSGQLRRASLLLRVHFIEDAAVTRVFQGRHQHF
jgi:hypothetical protein